MENKIRTLISPMRMSFIGIFHQRHSKKKKKFIGIFHRLPHICAPCRGFISLPLTRIYLILHSSNE